MMGCMSALVPIPTELLAALCRCVSAGNEGSFACKSAVVCRKASAVVVSENGARSAFVACRDVRCAFVKASASVYICYSIGFFRWMLFLPSPLELGVVRSDTRAALVERLGEMTRGLRLEL